MLVTPTHRHFGIDSDARSRSFRRLACSLGKCRTWLRDESVASGGRRGRYPDSVSGTVGDDRAVSECGSAGDF